MLTTLVLSGALALGQPPAPPEPPQALPQLKATDAEPVDFTATIPATPPPAAPADAAAAPAVRWPLMRAAQGTWLGALLDDNRLTVNGWTEMSYTASTARGTNLPTTLNDRPREFLLNQNYLHVERTIDTAKREFQLGFVVDQILPGTDYRYTISRGLLDSQLTDGPDGGPRLYGYDLFQVYGQAFLPDVGPMGTKLVVGRFATPIGYEVVQAVDTPFLSRAYLFQYNPFTHTGTWATSQLTPEWSVGNGVVTGADNVFNPARPTYIGQLKWAPPTGRTSVAGNVMVTNPVFDENKTYTFFNCFDLLVTHKVSDRLTYTLDATYSYTRDVPDIGYADWYGMAQYLTYQLSPTLASTVRAEVFNDTTGFRTGYEGLYTEVTAGLAWKPVPELLVRPFARFDHNNQSQPFEGKPDLFTAGLDLIVRW